MGRYWRAGKKMAWFDGLIGYGKGEKMAEDRTLQEVEAVNAEIKMAELLVLRQEVCLWVRRWEGAPGQVWQHTVAAGKHLDLAVKLQEVEVKDSKCAASGEETEEGGKDEQVREEGWWRQGG